MGIIDDYYGGYESLAFFTDDNGVVDFEAAYGEHRQHWVYLPVSVVTAADKTNQLL